MEQKRDYFMCKQMMTNIANHVVYVSLQAPIKDFRLIRNLGFLVFLCTK